MPENRDEEPTDRTVAGDWLAASVVEFTRRLRRAGARVPANAAITATRALLVVGLDDEPRARAALRAALVSRREDLETFDRLFPAFWEGLSEDATDESVARAPESAERTPHAGSDPLDGGPEPADEQGAMEEVGADGALVDAETTERRLAEGENDDGTGGETRVYSPAGRSEQVTGGTLSPVADDLAASVGRLTHALATLRGRRWVADGEERVDTRRALRRSVETGGVVLSLPHLDRKPTGVRGVVLVDVSQSVLDTIDRDFLIGFLREIHETWRRVRIFFFDTDLREVTAGFDAPTAGAALAALETAEAEWGGGTRIGRALETLRVEYPDSVDRTTAVLVISDGLEVGEIDGLTGGMAWLSGRASSVLWLNPLAASVAYEPTCRGMAAALAYVDGLFAFAGAEDVDEVASQLERYGAGGRIGYRYDGRPRAQGHI